MKKHKVKIETLVDSVVEVLAAFSSKRMATLICVAPWGEIVRVKTQSRNIVDACKQGIWGYCYLYKNGAQICIKKIGG